MLDHVANPTLRTQAHGVIADPVGFPRLSPLGVAGLMRPLPRAVEGERWRSKAGVLRPPPGPPYAKAAISASAAWRLTVAGPAIGGS
jgi:hypothetical protein